MSLEESGLLGDDWNEIQQTIRNLFEDFFAVCNKVNKLAHSVRNSIKLDYENILHIVTVCLLQKLIDSFQATILLSESGLEADARTVLRSAIEIMFILCKLSQDESYVIKYVGSDQLRRRTLVHIAKEGKLPAIKQHFTEEELQQRLSEIDADIKNLGLTKKRIEQIAHECGLDDWYQKIYRVLSEDAHSLPRSLERYTIFNGKNFTGFDVTPKTDTLEDVLDTICLVTLVGLDSVEKIFNTGFEDEIDRLHRFVRTRQSPK